MSQQSEPQWHVKSMWRKSGQATEFGDHHIENKVFDVIRKLILTDEIFVNERNYT